jgi:hypothetical protein
LFLNRWKKCGREADCFSRKNLTGDCFAEKQVYFEKNSNLKSLVFRFI